MDYPVEIARDLLWEVFMIPEDAFEVHGPGMEVKLFEAAKRGALAAEVWGFVCDDPRGYPSGSHRYYLLYPGEEQRPARSAYEKDVMALIGHCSIRRIIDVSHETEQQREIGDEDPLELLNTTIAAATLIPQLLKKTLVSHSMSY